MRYEVLELGTFVKVDENGFLLTNTVNEIPSPYLNAVGSIIDAYKSTFNSNLHSVYVRGSVARGNPIEEFSDFDCFAVLSDIPDTAEINELRTRATMLQTQFGFVSKFDFSFFQLADLMNDPEFMHWMFAMKIQSVRIYGDNLIPGLRQFRPDFEIAFSLKQLENRIAKAKQKLFKYFNPDQTKYWCSWIMRTVVRAGLELVIKREKQYTNELSLCYRVFSKYYPERSDQMNLALNLAINPITNFETINNLINDLGQWLVLERIHVYETNHG